jgi:polar amino acid transport system substrate-binding protein
LRIDIIFRDNRRNILKRIKKTFLIGILFAVSVSIVLSEDLFARSERKTIRIATVEYPPSFLKDGTGVAADMLTELFDKMGYDIAIKIYPLGRTIHMVNEGDIECVFLFPQTDPEVTVPIPLYYSSTVFVYKKSRFPDGVSYNTLSDLGGYRIGALTNSKWSVKLLQEGAGLKLDFAPSNDMNMKKLYVERIDLLPLTHMIAQSLIESVLPDKKEEFGLSAPFGITPVCLIFSTKYPGNQNIIDDVRRKVAEIDIRDILQKHFGKYFQEGIIPLYMMTGEISK